DVRRHRHRRLRRGHRRRGCAAQARARPPRGDHAVNRTFGLRTTPGYIVSAVVAALAGGLIASYFGSSIYGTDGVAVILALAVMLTWRGSTAPEWVRRRRHVASRLLPLSVATRDRAAVTWDREREEATVWLEIAPATPFSITEVDADGNIGREPVDL